MTETDLVRVTVGETVLVLANEVGATVNVLDKDPVSEVDRVRLTEVVLDLVLTGVIDLVTETVRDAVGVTTNDVGTGLTVLDKDPVSEVERVRVTVCITEPVLACVIDRVSVTETVSEATEYVRERVFDWDRVIGETDTDTENDIGEEEALTVSVAGVTVGPGEAVRTLGLDVGDTVCDTILDPDGDGDTETTGVIDSVGPRDIEDMGL